MASSSADPKWQGAEARVSIIEWFGRTAILKQRFRKTYRHPTLDQKLLTRRITQEVRCLVKAYRSGVSAPIVYFADSDNGAIVMEHIHGHTAKQTIADSLLAKDEISRKIGQLVAATHACDLVHGDLTTSNIMFRGTDAVLIDFGLAQVSSMTEDKAVDLYVLERAILSTHPESPELFSNILTAYADATSPDTAKTTLAKLAEVQLRGRKRSMVG